MPGVTHRFPRSVIPLLETVGRGQARNRHDLYRSWHNIYVGVHTPTSVVEVDLLYQVRVFPHTREFNRVFRIEFHYSQLVGQPKGLGKFDKLETKSSDRRQGPSILHRREKFRAGQHFGRD